MYTYTLIYTSKLPFVKHEVLILPSGRATHNHPDKDVVVESAEQAINGQRVIHRKHVQSVLPENVILERAYLISRYRRYSLRYNCEDYIAELFGGTPASKQRSSWLIFSLIGFGLIAAR